MSYLCISVSATFFLFFEVRDEIRGDNTKFEDLSTFFHSKDEEMKAPMYVEPIETVHLSRQCLNIAQDDDEEEEEVEYTTART